MAAITLNEITKYVKFNQTNVDLSLSVNEEYLQPIRIPTRVENPNDVLIEEETQVKDTNVLKYKYDEIINLPTSFSEFLDLNNYYSYGVDKDHSFIYSFMYVYDNEFKLDTEKKKTEKVILLVQDLLDTLNNPDLKYPKKTAINNALKEDNYIQTNVLAFICEHYNLNICIIDLNEKTHLSGNPNLNEDFSNIVIMKSGLHYFPLIHMYGLQLDYNVLIKLMKTYS